MIMVEVFPASNRKVATESNRNNIFSGKVRMLFIFAAKVRKFGCRNTFVDNSIILHFCFLLLLGYIMSNTYCS